MKFFLNSTPRPLKTAVYATAILLGLLAFSCAAQTISKPEQPKGQVIFSRTMDENGQITTGHAAVGDTAPPQVAERDHKAQCAQAPSAPPQVVDAERAAVTFTALEMDVRLRPAEQQIAVRAQLTLRNDGATPLAHIPLQISSSLNWERILLSFPAGPGKDAVFQVATLNSDVDHTGQLHEAAVALSEPLAPGASLHFDVNYSGTIAASARRLQSIGTPDEIALHSDWDQIGVDFTGLRGFGNVLWYPASSVPVLLGDGARLFDAMGEHKLRLSGARFSLRLTVEFPHGQTPTVALINGHAVPLAVTESKLDQSQEVASVATASLDGATLGFEAPSLFVAIRTAHPGTNLTAWTIPDDDVAVQFWTAAAEAVTPFLQGWLGRQPHTSLTLLDLPDPQDAPFETGALLAAPLREPSAKANPEGLNGVLVHALTHAGLPAPLPAWRNEGVATFMSSLWVEKQSGHDAALRTLEAGRSAMALAEPESPGHGVGQPLAQAISPVYYRTKAAYVLWMLRDQVGDVALGSALKAATLANGSSFERLLETGETYHDLSWFFADWVNADKGLPDLSIEGVYSSTASAGNWLVAVNVANAGYAAAEVAVTVRSGSGAEARSATQRLLIPSRSKAVQRILIQGKPNEVQVNDGTVPETQASVHLLKLDEPAAAAPSQPAQH